MHLLVLLYRKRQRQITQSSRIACVTPVNEIYQASPLSLAKHPDHKITRLFPGNMGQPNSTGKQRKHRTSSAAAAPVPHNQSEPEEAKVFVTDQETTEISLLDKRLIGNSSQDLLGYMEDYFPPMRNDWHAHRLLSPTCRDANSDVDNGELRVAANWQVNGAACRSLRMCQKCLAPAYLGDAQTISRAFSIPSKPLPWGISATIFTVGTQQKEGRGELAEWSIGMRRLPDPLISRQPNQPIGSIRVWSAACLTG